MPRGGRFHGLSPTLEAGHAQALGDGGQVILLLNRRGFSTHVHCPACGHVEPCQFCDLALTFHRQRDVMLCHYCGYEQQPPAQVPQVRPGARCATRALGTEKLQAEIEEKFPGYVVRRMDSDTMKRPGSHAQAARRLPPRRDPHPARHADDRQGAGFPQRDAGRRRQRRHRPAPPRLPRPSGPAVAGGRPDRPRAARRRAGADLLAGPSRHRPGGRPRLRALRRHRAGPPQGAQLSAVPPPGPADHQEPQAGRRGSIRRPLAGHFGWRWKK